MSMLTPPGMGGRYRITGDSYPRMRRPRRRRRIVVATTAAAVALGVLSWGTVQLVDVFTGGGTRVRAADGRSCERADGTRVRPAGASASPRVPGASARPAATAVPKPSAVTVNVYNATTRKGLARTTADALRKRGFRIGRVDNAPAALDKKVKGAGLLVGPPNAYRTGAFDVLRAQLPGAGVRPVDRRGGGIDLVIGDAFRGLAAEKDVRTAVAALTRPSPSPSPSGC